MVVVLVSLGMLPESVVVCASHEQATEVVKRQMGSETPEDHPEYPDFVAFGETEIRIMAAVAPEGFFNFLVQAEIAEVEKEGSFNSDEEAVEWLEEIAPLMEKNLQDNHLPAEIQHYLQHGYGS